GGEAVHNDIVKAWRDHVGERPRIYNTYGPTEATVWVVSTELTSPPERPMRRTPIGRPVPNGPAYILDDRGAPVPIGIAGELHLGGSQIARGYLNRPDLTAERFVPDPFSEIPCARMYRSGDLATWLPNGDIAFLGRLDRQVKIRGFRVEPGEIETTLRSHPQVLDGAVIARPGAGGVARLLGYAVCQPGVEAGELTTWLQSRLPPFMVPAAITILEELPRTTSRKLDERALPEPDLGARPRRDQSGATPETGLNAAVRAIWAEVLEIDEVPDGASFFELGGHSLLAIRVMSRLRDRIGVDLPLTELFTNATIETFSEAVARHAPDQAAVGGAGSGSSGPDGQGPSNDEDEIATLLAELGQLGEEEAMALLAELETPGDPGSGT
ncbi:MAG: AMP-binding protein, partial [Acidimicrobiia bacterium]